MTVPIPIPAIAKALTDPQRRALLWLNEDGSPRIPDNNKNRTALWGLVAKPIAPYITAQLADRSTEVAGLSISYRWWATPLGLKVRRHIVETQAKGT